METGSAVETDYAVETDSAAAIGSAVETDSAAETGFAVETGSAAVFARARRCPTAPTSSSLRRPRRPSGQPAAFSAHPSPHSSSPALPHTQTVVSSAHRSQPATPRPSRAGSHPPAPPRRSHRTGDKQTRLALPAKHLVGIPRVGKRRRYHLEYADLGWQ